MGRHEELRVDIEPLARNWVRDERLRRDVGGHDLRFPGQRVVVGYRQHQFVVKNRPVFEAWTLYRIGGDKKINLVPQQGSEPAEPKSRAHVEINIWSYG